jgi:hypothetical protein
MVDELIALSVSAFAPETADRMRAIGAAAGRRAKRFSTAAFEARLMSILGRALSASGAEPKG